MKGLSFTSEFASGNFTFGGGHRAGFELSDKHYSMLVTEELLEAISTSAAKQTLTDFSEALLLTAEGKVDAGLAEPGDEKPYVILRASDADKVRKQAQ